jgi:hypothetical protein
MLHFEVQVDDLKPPSTPRSKPAVGKHHGSRRTATASASASCSIPPAIHFACFSEASRTQHTRAHRLAVCVSPAARPFSKRMAARNRPECVATATVSALIHFAHPALHNANLSDALVVGEPVALGSARAAQAR